ncbi:MAG: transcription antitermination factor NusB [Anaerostipes sp.]|nr:transcription antitermination factor NusB [Anaerostipes sp.]
MTRSELREQMFRLCFSIEFIDSDEFEEQITLYFENQVDVSEKNRVYIKTRALDMMSHLEEIDSKIGSYSQGWNIARLGKAELSILRLAIYEILFDDDIPGNVAISEAVKITNQYCDEKAKSFINGILGKIEKDEANQ